MKGNSTTNKITEGAVIVALTVVLNFFKLDLGPEGGSVNLVFIPLMVFALRRGTFWGIGAGLVFGVLKAIIGGGISYGWQSLLLDYAVAYALVGLAGLLPSKPVLSTVFGAAGCLAAGRKDSPESPEEKPGPVSEASDNAECGSTDSVSVTSGSAESGTAASEKSD